MTELPNFDVVALDPRQLALHQQHLDQKTKPRGSLGQLETLAARLFSIRTPAPEPRAAVVVFAADHGVAAEGVSAFPQEVTRQMLLNFAEGGAAINALCAAASAELLVIDVGTKGPTPAGVREEKICHGSANMALGPALTAAQARAALDVGRRVAGELAEQGFDLVATGEMGIGNTTAAAAVAAIITGAPLATLVGRGTGVDDTGLQRKQAVLQRILARHAGVRAPFDVLQRVGGLELAALVGLVLGAAERRVAVVLDGYITGAAALLAQGICPQVTDYCFASHCSVEPGHAVILSTLGLRPLLDLDLRLGEGSGAALSLPLFRAAAHVYNDMATFAQAGVSQEGT